MAIFVKDWPDFQHFKDRNPIWIKLYRRLLDDINWHELDAESAKTLISLWLLASEDKRMQGELPPVKEIAFRLRTTERSLKSSISKLSHWLRQDDINTISDIDLISNGNQVDALEKRREETDINIKSLFEDFWKAYPKRVAKPAALKAWLKISPVNGDFEKIMEALDWAKNSQQWKGDNGKFIPYPASWLNARRFEDEQVDQQSTEQRSSRVAI